MYTIVCDNGHERKDRRTRGICTVCGLLMRLKPVKKYERPKEEING